MSSTCGRYLEHGSHRTLAWRVPGGNPVPRDPGPTLLSSRVTTDRGPRLIISYDTTTPSVFSFRDAARGLCHLVWMVDRSDPEMANPSKLLSRVGIVVDVAGLTQHETVEALRSTRPTGIMAFNDRTIGPLSAMADALDLEFHSPEVALRLTDKLHQRRAMASAGVPVPAFWEFPFGLSTAEAVHQSESVRLPAVLKPRSGDGSRNVHHVHTSEQLIDLITTPLAPGQEGEGWLLESYLEGPTRPVSRFADVVSVESFLQNGTLHHLCVNGRFPFAEPFRETGCVLPSDLSPADSHAAQDVAAAAIAALDIRCGCQHTEVKFTPEGPVVVEVNGRVGGGVPRIDGHGRGRDRSVPGGHGVGAGMRALGHASPPPPEGGVPPAGHSPGLGPAGRDDGGPRAAPTRARRGGHLHQQAPGRRRRLAVGPRRARLQRLRFGGRL